MLLLLQSLLHVSPAAQHSRVVSALWNCDWCSSCAGSPTCGELRLAAKPQLCRLTVQATPCSSVLVD